ncbi:hypothetical protein Golax_009329, partial [Gossypium laxum]|nr:hypothetical protein [Gossypium laxum]
MIGGYLMPNLSRNLVHLRWNHSASYIGIPTALEDIRLLLDQRLEAHSYAKLECMTQCISFLDNSDSTDDIEAIVARWIARGTIEELISLPIPIALWDSSTSAVGDANIFVFFILS